MLKNKLLFLLTFALGMGSGAFVHYKLTQRPTEPTAQTWNESEETTRKRMYDFQTRLDALEKEDPKDVDTLSKQIEAQRGIENIIIDYRNAQYAKYTPLLVFVGAIVAALITAIVTLRVAKRN